MRLRITTWLAVSVACLLALTARAQTEQTFETVGGERFVGRAAGFRDTGLLVALQGGGYTNVAWGRLTQPTLQELTKVKQAAPFVSVFLLSPESTGTSRRAKAEVALSPVPRPERPQGGSLFASPVMVTLFLLLYLANFYAAYEIAIYRQQPAALVVGLAAIFPIVGPIIFLSLPTRTYTTEEPYEEPPYEAPVDHGHDHAHGHGHAEADAAPTASTPAHPAPVVFRRGQTSFNRRFFETKMAPYLKIHPGEAERDMVIDMQSARGNYVGHRFSKVDQTEVHLQIRNGAASQDVAIPFTEIHEIKLRHKDA